MPALVWKISSVCRTPWSPKTVSTTRSTNCALPRKISKMISSSALGELFQLDYELLLYDLTSTYFEGLAQANELARRGYSRDHRSDCQQVIVALVVTRNSPGPLHLGRQHPGLENG